MRAAQEIDDLLAGHRISAEDRILLSYRRKQLDSAMLSGDEDASVLANVILHKLIGKYQSPDHL